MRLLGKPAIVLSVAGAMALASMTASEARGHRGAFVAGAAGFAAGAAIGAAAANNSYYYGNGYYDGGYDNGYNAYGYAADGPGSAYTGDPSYYGGASYSYSPRYYGTQNGPVRERVLEGHDY